MGSVERSARGVAFADREEFCRVGVVEIGGGTEPTQGVALPGGTVFGPFDEVSKDRRFSRQGIGHTKNLHGRGDGERLNESSAAS